MSEETIPILCPNCWKVVQKPRNMVKSTDEKSGYSIVDPNIFDLTEHFKTCEGLKK